MGSNRKKFKLTLKKKKQRVTSAFNSSSTIQAIETTLLVPLPQHIQVNKLSSSTSSPAEETQQNIPKKKKKRNPNAATARDVAKTSKITKKIFKPGCLLTEILMARKRSKSEELSEQELLQRRSYIQSAISQGNKQFEEDKNSLWAGQTTDYSTDDSSESSDHNHIRCVSAKVHCNQKTDKPLQHVQFTESNTDQVFFMLVNRIPPGKDNPIFDENKTWITDLMNLQPKKPSLKKRNGSSIYNISNEAQQLQRNLQITLSTEDASQPIDQCTNRVMYEEDNVLYFVETSFSYTSFSTAAIATTMTVESFPPSSLNVIEIFSDTIID